MATGASAAKRKAKKAAADQYYKAFSELKSANADYKASANNKKQVVDAMGDDVSYGSKRLAMKADRLGRDINGNKEYREDLKRYNSRYEGLKKQLSGQAVERYKASSNPVAEANPSGGMLTQGGINGFGSNTNPNGSSIAGKGGLANVLGFGMKKSATEKGRELADDRYYDTQEEAMQDAQARMNQYNASMDAKLGKRIEADPSSSQAGMAAYSNNSFRGNYTQADIDKAKVNDASKFVQKEKLNGIAVGYRQLEDMESAYGEIAALSEKAGNSPVNKQAEDYAKTTEQLKQKLRREQGNAGNKPSGLLASELAGNNLNPEVIRA
jgi:hypothetical protein